MDCRNPEYKDVLIEQPIASNKIEYKKSVNGCVTNAIHGNWIPAIPAGMTA